MATKLTLSLDQAVIDKAKVYAKAHNVSLSGLVERYLERITSGEAYAMHANASVTDELSGMLNEPSPEFTYEAAKYKNLKKKYGL